MSLQNTLAGEHKEQRIRGLFSSQEIRKVGTGTTTRKTVQKVFWFAEGEQDGEITIQPINANYVPTGAKRTITMEELLQKFSPEPEFYMQSVYPKIRTLETSIEDGDKHRSKNETFSAEHSYSTALNLDEENVQANFGIGLTYLTRGETDKAKNIFERLVKLEATFQEEHKHLFNEFGISLRKNKMVDQAIDYYRRALELTQNDENLHINIARAYIEIQAYDECVTHLLESLTIAPNNPTALQFLTWMDSKKLIPAAFNDDVQQILAPQLPPQDQSPHDQPPQDQPPHDQ